MQIIRVHQPLDAFTLDVDLTLSRRVTGLFGPSGSGKTTLLNCVAGLVTPRRGLVQIGERVLYACDQGRVRTRVPVRQRRIGYVFQDPLLFEHMTVEGNLRYGRRSGDGPKFSQVVHVLELGGLLSRRAHALSGGEKRRVAIGRALLSGPQFLLLDEPLTGLDRRLAGKSLCYIRAVLDAFAVPAIYVSHLVSDVVYLCDEVIVLDRGRVTAQGAPAELIGQMESADPSQPPSLKNMFAAAVEAIDPAAGTVTCRVGDQPLVVVGRVPPDATRVTAIVPARDIILATQMPKGISARNVLRGPIARIEPVHGHRVVFVDLGYARRKGVRMNLCEAPEGPFRQIHPDTFSLSWMVEITAAAMQELDLAVGKDVYVIVKASSVQVVDASAQTH
jgi:molybdate transport system ATP-binding protein